MLIRPGRKGRSKQAESGSSAIHADGDGIDLHVVATGLLAAHSAAYIQSNVCATRASTESCCVRTNGHALEELVATVGAFPTVGFY